jgi:hypothetical protein
MVTAIRRDRCPAFNLLDDLRSTSSPWAAAFTDSVIVATDEASTHVATAASKVG